MTKILRFRAKNFKNIREVEIIPEGAMTVIGGLNAQGKTSCLSGIASCLQGLRFTDKMPIRDGEETGFTEVMLDGDGTIDPVPIIVRRHWEEFGKKTWLTITTQDGYEASSPQTLLNDFFSAVTFDPLAFSRMKPDEQARQLKALVNLDIDSLDEEAAVLYKERTNVNQAGQSLKAKLDSAVRHNDVSDIPVDLERLTKQLQSAEKVNASYNAAKRKCDVADYERDDLHRALERARGELASIDNLYRLACSKSHAAAVDFAAMGNVDTVKVVEAIRTASETAKKQDENAKYCELSEELGLLRVRSKNLTDLLKAISEKKSAALKDVKWPMEGLSVEGSGVLYNGVPLSQVSSSEALDIAVAIGIAMNPELRVMLIKDGALIGDEKLRIIKERAEANDYQIWVEDVCRNEQDTERCSIVIRDGLVAQEPGGRD